MKNFHLATSFTLLASFGIHAQNVASTSTLTSGGMQAGANGSNSTYYGYRAGAASTAASGYNVFLGGNAGANNTNGSSNTFIGFWAGRSNTSGSANIAIGSEAGQGNLTGSENVFIGNQPGGNCNQNTVIGTAAGQNGGLGNNNTYIGYKAGGETAGSDNVMIGRYAGFSTGPYNHQLIISNKETHYPLIWGDFMYNQLQFNAVVGIGEQRRFPSESATVDVSNYKLFVEGGILTEAVRVSLLDTWGDYVFKDEYKLMPLKEVDCYIEENGHLPEMPSAAEIEKDGLELGDMARMQQVKIEELTLYAIQQQKQLEKQEIEIKELKELVKELIEKK